MFLERGLNLKSFTSIKKQVEPHHKAIPGCVCAHVGWPLSMERRPLNDPARSCNAPSRVVYNLNFKPFLFTRQSCLKVRNRNSGTQSPTHTHTIKRGFYRDFSRFLNSRADGALKHMLPSDEQGKSRENIFHVK